MRYGISKESPLLDPLTFTVFIHPLACCINQRNSSRAVVVAALRNLRAGIGNRFGIRATIVLLRRNHPKHEFAIRVNRAWNDGALDDSSVCSKGTLLSPQHLQMQDRFLEDSLQFRMETLSYCAWGFRELKVDRDTLAAG